MFLLSLIILFYGSAGFLGGFLIAIAVLACTIAGLTIRSSHSLNRKMEHLLIAAFGLILTFVSPVRLVRTILFADWLS